MEDVQLKKKILFIITALTLAFSLTACGEDPDLPNSKQKWKISATQLPRLMKELIV